jgi:ribose 5-phosphate isomerase A
MSDADAGKKAAAEAAVALIENGMRLGLGTGSTMRHALEALGRRVRDEGLKIVGMPTSEATAAQAAALGIPLGDAASLETLDLAIDGADEVERGSLHLIKGLGGALLREKIVMQASRRFVVVVDSSKLVARLGAHAPVPVETVRFGHAATARRLAALGGVPSLRCTDGEPFVTDGGNLIYDCRGFRSISNPRDLDRELKTIAGVVETGLFVDPVERCIVGAPEGTASVLRPDAATPPVIAVVMGVSGSGKSTIAALLAQSLGCPFQEGDDLHPPENVAKMQGGTPLTDADRQPWLRKIAALIDEWRAHGRSGVLTCSALKRSYRDIVIGKRPDVTLVYLKGSYDLIRRRMAARHEHFMPVALLDSQCAALEEPTPDEHAVVVGVDGAPRDVAAEVVRRLTEHIPRAASTPTSPRPSPL